MLNPSRIAVILLDPFVGVVLVFAFFLLGVWTGMIYAESKYPAPAPCSKDLLRFSPVTRCLNNTGWMTLGNKKGEAHSSGCLASCVFFAIFYKSSDGEAVVSAGFASSLAEPPVSSVVDCSTAKSFFKFARRSIPPIVLVVGSPSRGLFTSNLGGTAA